jgi:hypothetical protein
MSLFAQNRSKTRHAVQIARGQRRGEALITGAGHQGEI